MLSACASLFEAAWRGMTARYTVFEITVYGSALLHVALTLCLGAWGVALQRCGSASKLQGDEPPPSAGSWARTLGVVLLSQLAVQLPLVVGQFYFVTWFGVPLGYDAIPGAYDLGWRLVLALVLEDTWNYWLHRALHDPRVYKHVHKVHHSHTAPFTMVAEMAHPVETVPCAPITPPRHTHT